MSSKYDKLQAALQNAKPNEDGLFTFGPEILGSINQVIRQAKASEKCVLLDWVQRLPLRYQGTLLTGMRCCDVSPKNPVTTVEKTGCSTGEDSPERALHAFLRFCTLKPADAREMDIPGAWFRSTPPCDWKPSQFGHYPLHWFSHLMHCFEVVGYNHPNKQTAHEAKRIYIRLAESLHLTPETSFQMYHRLTEDRIASGQVVS